MATAAMDHHEAAIVIDSELREREKERESDTGLFVSWRELVHARA